MGFRANFIIYAKQKVVFQLFQLLLGIDAKTNKKNNETKHSLSSKRYTYREHLRPGPFKDCAAASNPVRFTAMSRKVMRKWHQRTKEVVGLYQGKKATRCPQPCQVNGYASPSIQLVLESQGPILTCDIHLDYAAIEQALPLPSKNHSVDSAFLLDDRLETIGSSAISVILGFRFRGRR